MRAVILAAVVVLQSAASAQDVIVIPPGVAHWFSAMDADVNYLVVPVGADHVLPAGYVNPAIK